MPSSKKEPGSSGDFLLSRDSGAQLPSSPWLLWLPEKAQGTWVWGAVWHFPLYSPGLKSRHTYGKARWDVRAAVVQEKKQARQTTTVSAALRPSGHLKSVSPFSVHIKHTQAHRAPAVASPGSLSPHPAHYQGRLGDEQVQMWLFARQQQVN